ncbi:MAG: T9SS type A sorting domain-containing protein [Bacteroidetes bacterium]|nr:T9SS type A sorting domain-containing protein [Bacteroidota bacterium]
MFLFLFLLGMCSSLFSQIVDFPDPNFKFACVNFSIVDTDGDGIPDSDVDSNDDGEIQVSEAEAVIDFYPVNSGIFSMAGIEAFANVRRLNCSQNNLTALDVTQNTNLEELSCFFNELTELDVSTLSQLKILNFDLNDVTSIDVTQNPLLERLFAPINRLSTIDLSQNPNLISLNLDDNLLTEIDLTQNTQLQFVSFDTNEINTMDFSNNPALSVIDIFENNITTLDLSQNPNVTKLWCYENQLESLNLRNGANTEILILNTEGNPNLDCIEVDDVDYANDQSAWFIDDTASYSENCLLGQEDTSVIDLVVYPNPVRDVLHVTSEVNAVEKIIIFDVLGRKLFEENEDLETMNISSLPTGFLLLKFELDGISVIKKIVKE